MSSRDNNFTAVRILAALFVFAGHLGAIMNGPFLNIISYPIQELGVVLLFLESGYLITKSWENDPHPLRYAIKRFFRLWPPLAAYVLLMVFVAGPMLSSLGREGYFQSGYQIYLGNLLFHTSYSQPGVFVGLPQNNVTNASIWTMPVEAVMYIICPLLYELFYRSKRRVSFTLITVLTGIFCALDFYLRAVWADRAVVFYATNWIQAFHLGTVFLIGMLYTREEVQKYLNVQAGFFALLLWMVYQPANTVLRYAMLYVLIPYAVFSFALAPHPFFYRMGRRMELSYGIYLYGFFFEQLVVWEFVQAGIEARYQYCFIISLLLTIAASIVSYYLIEQPSKKLTRYLTHRLAGTGHRQE